jgi:hypothetical protein
VKPQDESAARTDFENRTKAVFDDSVGELNANVRSRLTQARHAAIAELEQTSRSPLRRAWMPAAGLVAAALIAALIFVPGLNRTLRSPDAPLADDDMPILLDSDDVELVEEMEFYAWLDNEALLDTQPEAREPANPQSADPARS